MTHDDSRRTVQGPARPEDPAETARWEAEKRDGPPDVCSRSPRPGEAAFGFCKGCGHAVLMHSTKGPCVLCQLLANTAPTVVHLLPGRTPPEFLGPIARYFAGGDR